MGHSYSLSDVLLLDILFRTNICCMFYNFYIPVKKVSWIFSVIDIFQVLPWCWWYPVDLSSNLFWWYRWSTPATRLLKWLWHFSSSNRVIRKGSYLSYLSSWSHLPFLFLFASFPKFFPLYLDISQEWKFVLLENHMWYFYICYLTGWAELIRGPYQRHILPGGHFYLMENDNESTLLRMITEILGVTVE